MAYKQNKWKEVYAVLKERILSGQYPAGSEFPTNKEIGEEFDLHTVSTNSAVSELIRDGLVLPSPSRSKRRRVREFVSKRSKRKGGFSNDSKGTNFHKELVELKIINDAAELPEKISDVMKPPVLYYHHNQFIEGVQVANSRSYIPDIFNLAELERRLSVKGASLSESMEALGHKPSVVEEALIASASTTEDNKLLNLPGNSNITVARIDRKVFDDDGNLIEFCYLTDRCDCYIFEYRFPF
jgi:GntR family transcriptional regulator